MEKYDKYKIEIEKILQNSDGKVTLARKIGRRNSYVFSIGTPSYDSSSIIFEDKDIVVFEEGLALDKIELIKKLFEN